MKHGAVHRAELLYPHKHITISYFKKLLHSTLTQLSQMRINKLILHQEQSLDNILLPPADDHTREVSSSALLYSIQVIYSDEIILLGPFGSMVYH